MKKKIGDVVGRILGHRRMGPNLVVKDGKEVLCADLDDLRCAYRLLLGREPDDEGFQTYQKKIRNERITTVELADHFLGSHEFAARHSCPVRRIEFDGYSLLVRDGDSDVSRTIAAGNVYEPNVTSALQEVLRAGFVFMDIGANIGYYTAMAASRVGPTGRVIAVEPMDKNLQLILATLQDNEFANVFVIPYAASDRDSIVAMSTAPGSSNGEIVLNNDGAGNPAIYAIARKLDDVAPAMDRLDVVKIDVEGHEFHALRGFEKNILRFRPIIFTEFHPKCMRELSGTDPMDYYSLLAKYGGRIDILGFDGRRSACSSFEDLMAAWRFAGDALDVGDGAHLDLLVFPSS